MTHTDPHGFRSPMASRFPWRAGDDPPDDPTQTDDTAKAGGGLPLEGADEPLDGSEEN